MDGEDDGGGSLALPGSCVGIEVSAGEDENVFGVKDRLREAWEEFDGSSGRNASGTEWMASCASLGARRKGNQGDSPTGNDLLSWEERASQYRAKAAAGVAGSVTRRVAEHRSLSLVVTVRGRIQFASLRTRAAMSGKVAAIRGAWGCSEGEERGA